MEGYTQEAEENKLKTYVFTNGDFSFTCKASNQDEANKFFNQGHFYDGKQKLTSENPNIVCEIKDNL